MPEVSNGDLTGNVVGDGSDEASYFNWQLASQSVEGNYSDLNWQVGWYFVDLSCRGLRKGAASVNGSYVYYDFDAGDGVHAFVGGHDHRPSLEIASGTVRVNHGPDGACNFGAFVTMTGFNNQKSEGSSTWDLPTIAVINPAPSMPEVTAVAQTTMVVKFTDGEGGGTVDARQIRYGTDPDGVGATVIPSTGFSTLTGLTPGTTYYIWARTHSAAGYSPWSSRTTQKTIAGAFIFVDGVVKEAIPYVKDAGVWKIARPWAKSLGVWKEAQ